VAAVLDNLSARIRECLQHAEDCARKAAELPNGSQLKLDYLNLEKHWRGLARRLSSGERPADFNVETGRGAGAPVISFLRNQAFDPETIEIMAKAFVAPCESLGLSPREDAITKLIAEKIIELAQRGFKDPTALYSRAIKELSGSE
jgi:hypothetical protein